MLVTSWHKHIVGRRMCARREMRLNVSYKLAQAQSGQKNECTERDEIRCKLQVGTSTKWAEERVHGTDGQHVTV
jgi:hypothetical protein